MLRTIIQRKELNKRAQKYNRVQTLETAALRAGMAASNLGIAQPASKILGAGTDLASPSLLRVV